MSSRSVKKRRHREDFQGYIHARTVEKVAGGPLWKRAGFTTQDAYLQYLQSKPKDGPQFGSQPALPHVHGPDCHHGAALSQAEANAMTDEQWIEEPRLTVEEAEAFTNADNEEGEPF